MFSLSSPTTRTLYQSHIKDGGLVGGRSIDSSHCLKKAVGNCDERGELYIDQRVQGLHFLLGACPVIGNKGSVVMHPCIKSRISYPSEFKLDSAIFRLMNQVLPHPRSTTSIGSLLGTRNISSWRPHSERRSFQFAGVMKRLRSPWKTLF